MSFVFFTKIGKKFYSLSLFFLMFYLNSYSQYFFYDSTNDTIKTYASISALSSGNWYKIKIDKTGIYKLTYEQLKEIGLKNPANVRVYGYGGKQLPFMNDVFNHDDMVENPILIEKGSDNVFNNGDYILFFSIGIQYWSFSNTENMFLKHKHNYSNFIYLFLTDSFGEGLRIENKNNVLTANYKSNETDLMQGYIEEYTNPSKTGRVWFSKEIASGGSTEYSFDFKNKIADEPVFAKTLTAGRKNKNVPNLHINIYEGNKKLKTITTVNDLDHYVYAYQETNNFNFVPSNNKFSLNYLVTGGDASSEAFVGYLCLNTRGNLVFNDNQYFFRDKKSVGTNKITEFVIDNNGKYLSVWDITKPYKPVAVDVNTESNKSYFTIKTDSLREFVAFTSDFLTPIYEGNDVGKIKNQNLHGARNYDMLIVSHPNFIKQAKELAEFRRKGKQPLKTLITTPQEIYNEFSSGTPDISAIRNMARMLYSTADTNNKLKYLLLIGDGTYDNKSIVSKNKNLILTYQNQNSMDEISSYMGDDFFGLLEKHEGENTGSLDVGVGRFPVNTEEQAQLMVNKTKKYESIETKGSWRQNLCFIADDEDSNLHLNDADFLADKVVKNKEFNIKKIYLDAHKQVVMSSGQRYPTVNKAIETVIKKGALIIDYVGHGNSRILAKEEILHDVDIEKWKNYNKLPIFITASCEVGRFDNHNITSLGEWFVLSPNGGGVVALTTTRVVYAGSNQNLNVAFFERVFNKNLRLGDVIREAKNDAYDMNKRKFVLLGDPSVKIPIPENKVLITNVKNTFVTQTHNKIPQIKYAEGNDTIRALGKAKISGYVVDKNDDLLDKDGVLYISIFDKSRFVSSLGNDKESYPTKFKIQNSVLYKGTVKINKGFFEAEFILPKDIDYKYGKGKISMYAILSDSTDASGYYDKIIIGGINHKADIDNESPDVNLYLNDTNFVSGSITNENPIMIAKIKDQSGINTSGIGIGHDIVATLDDDKVIVLNDFYEGSINKYNSGQITYPLTGISEGFHNLKLKVWDIQNNSAHAEINFYVHNADKITIQDIGNYPNPVNNFTNFHLKHNQSGENLKISIKIYNIVGKKVATITETQNNDAFSISPIYWDATNNNGYSIPNGMYIYNIEIETEDGKKINKSSKMMIFK